VPAPGCAGIELDHALRAVRLPDDVHLDLGGIAKGAAADLVVARLLDAGADGACVNVGGDLRVEGRAPTDAGWIVEVSFGDEFNRHVALRAGAVCTSTSTKRRWMTNDGERHHIIDPQQGRSTTGVRWVSVIAARATQGEILTKTVFVGGVATGSGFIERNGCAAVIIEDDSTVTELGSLEGIAA